MYLHRLKDPQEGEVQIYLLDRLKGAKVWIRPFLVRLTDTNHLSVVVSTSEV